MLYLRCKSCGTISEDGEIAKSSGTTVERIKDPSGNLKLRCPECGIASHWTKFDRLDIGNSDQSTPSPEAKATKKLYFFLCTCDGRDIKPTPTAPHCWKCGKRMSAVPREEYEKHSPRCKESAPKVDAEVFYYMCTCGMHDAKRTEGHYKCSRCGDLMVRVTKEYYFHNDDLLQQMGDSKETQAQSIPMWYMYTCRICKHTFQCNSPFGTTCPKCGEKCFRKDGKLVQPQSTDSTPSPEAVSSSTYTYNTTPSERALLVKFFRQIDRGEFPSYYTQRYPTIDE